MGRPVVTIVSSATADADGYATAQTLVAAGPLDLDGTLVSGGVGTPDFPCRVTVSSAGDDTGIDFTVTGTGPDRGNPGATLPLVEVITGANAGDATTVQQFSSVTDISASGATDGDVTAGTAAVSSTPWVPWDVNVRAPFQVGFGVTILEPTTWQLEVTLDDVYDQDVIPTAVVYNSLSGKTDNETGNISALVRASRLTLTAAGSARLSQIQQGD